MANCDPYVAPVPNTLLQNIPKGDITQRTREIITENFELLKYPNVTTQVTDDYTLTLEDCYSLVQVSDGAAAVLNVPENADVAFPVGTQINISQLGAGTVTITALGGVTLQSAGALLDTAAQFSVVSLLKTDEDTWVVTGDRA